MSAPSVQTKNYRDSIDFKQLPPTGAWLEGSHTAARKFCTLGALGLDNQHQLPQVTMAYQTWGTLNAERSNAVLVLHALTGDAHVTGPTMPGQNTAGWWSEVVGAGKAIDTEKYYVVAPNVLGGCQGSTGPASPAPEGKAWGSRFPQITTRDQVRAEARLADVLGIERWGLIIGASMGGQRALEWAIEYPDRVDSLAVIASNAATSADQAAWCHSQLLAIELDPLWNEGDYYEAPVGYGPSRGLALARAIAHTTYRSAPGLDMRFGRTTQAAEEPLTGGRYAVQSYLDYQGAKLAKRFDAGSYVTLTRTMLTHDVSRARGSISDALAKIRARTLIVGVDTDRLFTAEESDLLVKHIPNAVYHEIKSAHGHDGFLIENTQVETILQDFCQELAK